MKMRTSRILDIKENEKKKDDRAGSTEEYHYHLTPN